MRILAILLALLAMEAGIGLSPDTIMARAVAKSVLDVRTLRSRYEFETVNDDVATKKRCDNPNDGNMSIEELFGPKRYMFVHEDTIPLSLDGRSVYLINFSPRNSGQPDTPDDSSLCADIKNQTLNRLRGLVYVDREDYGIIRIVTHLNKPSVGIKIVGRLYKMDVIIQQFRLDDIWAPKEISIESEYSYFLGIKHSRERTHIEFRNFRLKAP